MSATAIDVGVPRKNREGYADPTMYQALKQVQCAEYGYRPLVYAPRIRETWKTTCS